MPTLIIPPGIDDKDACLFPEKIGGKYVILHRIQPSIDINRFDNLNFTGKRLLTHNPFVFPRKGMWDSAKVGISSVPLKTEKGWILLYHGVSADDSRYRIGVLLLDLKDPEKVLARSRLPRSLSRKSPTKRKVSSRTSSSPAARHQGQETFHLLRRCGQGRRCRHDAPEETLRSPRH